MGQYRNKFEEAIDNVPFSPNFVDVTNSILAIICDDFYNDCSYFQTMQSVPIKGGYFRTIVFEVHGEVYIYWDLIKEDRLECSQLERFVELGDNWENVVSLVIYSTDPTAKPLAQTILSIYKRTTIKDWVPSLNKG
ncbi:MAG: hypothetical protein IK073_05845 [Paludibacteraceae bacterium]|nr:hypothetical protein [Paludibacteraceae bacterium]